VTTPAKPDAVDLGAVLDRLWQVVRARRGADPETSYTARLFAAGRAKIAQKLGEEAVEAVIAGVAEQPAGLVAESADLLYHLLVLWADAGISPAEIAAELNRREGRSGIDEKRARARTDSGRACLAYDRDNVFARILRGEIPCNKVYEDEHVLAFRDIRPQAPTHVLVIPKGEYESLDDFADKASEAEMAALVRALGRIARIAGVAESGYRIIANTGPAAHQEVAHFHVHVFGGRDLGAMLPRR
jgi:histidine triad (HIT) family protein